ncbi:MAG: chromosome segregation protein SMC [Aquificae bacterium]|nr:chromosome segregation protein SMC [Aquificota bacterium]
MTKGAYIEKIVVEGFKSYGTKRKEIPLGEGFVAVVGPNGAGKSNVGDAIAFALGLSTARALRAKNLSYLIFSKNGQRAPHAYVEVHFRNLGAFPVPDERVVISRKVTPEGRSIFKINGVNVREKDLRDFLAKAGIYENAYNVVYQGDIVKFLKLTPTERRKILEEVSGIAEYERKKEKALEDLAQVELKVKEIELLLEEVKERLEKLRKEKEELERYEKLKNEELLLRAKIIRKEEIKLLRERERLLSELRDKQNKLKELLSLIQEKEGELEEREKELKEVSELIVPHKEKVGRLLEKVEGTERLLKQKEEELNEARKRKEDLRVLLENLRKDAETLEREISELTKEHEKLKREYDELKKLEEEKLRELEAQEERLRITLEEVRRLEEEKELITEKLEKLLSEKRELETRAKELEFKIKKTEQEIKDLIEEANREKERREKLKEELEKLLEIKKREEAQREKIERDIKLYEKRLKDIRKELEEILKERGAIEGEIRSAGEAWEVFKDIKGVYGSVASLIKVKEPEHITAIEVAGGGRLRHIVVENEDVAKECIDTAKRLGLGRFSFIPLSRVRAETKPLRYPRVKGAVDFAVNLVDYDPRFEKVVRFVFGDTLIVEDFQSAKAIGIGNYRMVTLEGELFEKSGVISGGSTKGGGELSLQHTKQLLEELIAKEEKLKKEEGDIQRKIKELRSLFSEKLALLRVTERKIQEIKNELTSISEEEYERKTKRAREYVETLREKLKETLSRINTVEDEIGYLKEKLSNLKLKEQDTRRHYSREGLEEKRREYSAVRRKVNEKESELRALEGELNKKRYELDYVKKEITNKESELSYLTDKTRELEREIKELKDELRRAKEEIKKTEESVYGLFKRKEELEKVVSSLRAGLGSLKLKEQELRESIHELEKQLQSVEQKLGELKTQLSEIPLEPPEEVPESVSKLKEELRRVSEELQRLGGVNMRAREDYEEELSRYEELKDKRQKLKEESKAIRNLIDEIETKKRKVFLETFRSVNKNLKRIFSFLSPGGRAEMFLDNEEDPFSGGVQLVVKPRGKDVQYLEAMSGGEKTLAALALIFAIQEHKPSPFYYFDEVDAHLDEVNARKVGQLIREKSKDAQFIVVTLREVVASFADRIIGVSARGGVSEVFTLENTALEELVKSS